MLNLKITSAFAEKDEDVYLLAFKERLQSILPPDFFLNDFEKNPLAIQKIAEKWHDILPLIEWTDLKDPPFYFSIFLCCQFRPNAFRFFREMLCRWLIPGQRLNAALQFTIDFSLPQINQALYIGGEVILQIDTPKQLQLVEKHLPIIETEIRLGVQSAYQANRIMEIKGLSTDEKTAMIQENIADLVKHRPQDFDFDIFSEMQHFLVLCKDEFKQVRSYKHMSRIICFHYLFRKALKHSLEAFPERRFVSTKLLRVTLDSFREKKKRVLGLVIGLSFLKENELFNQRHILKAVKNYIPNIKMVKGSFFNNAFRQDPTCMVYLEVEKEDETPFTLDETGLLKHELPDACENCIEQRYNPIFMPQNEEEILRDIIALSNQLTDLKDLPQVMISFERQTESKLEFLVIVVRVVKGETVPIQDLFLTRPTFLNFIPDRIKCVGFLRKIYRKEANVFRLQVKKDHYLRHDHSVDLYKARSEIAKELFHVIGDFRDFNGGTISKENELFAALSRLSGEKAKEHSFLLENFFYSLEPAVMRSVLKPHPLKKLFFLLLEAAHSQLKENHAIEVRAKEDVDYAYLMLTAEESYFRQEVQGVLDRFSPHESQIATCFVSHNGLYCMGILTRVAEPESVLKLRFAIEETVTVGAR